MNLSENLLARQLMVRPRLILAGIIGLSVIIFMPKSLSLHPITVLVIAWNVGACLYLLLVGIMIGRSTLESTQRRARLQDEGQWVILTVVVLAAMASLSAIVALLAVAKNLHGTARYGHIGLAAITIVSSWAFTHMMFALHYAHNYYISLARGKPAGLAFPGEEAPDYGDFVYFAFVIGTSAQTADVSFTSRSMRRVGLVQCVLAFLFNTTVLALTINIAASLF